MHEKAKAVDRGDGPAASKSYGERDHNTFPTRVNLPPPLRRRYLAARYAWRQAARHLATVRRLLERNP